MLFVKFKEVIARLKSDYALRQLNTMSGDLRIAFLDKTKALIHALMADINPKADKMTLPASWTDTPLLINATHLLIYRESLSLSQMNYEEYDYNYIGFLNRHPSFQEAIARKNPFMLHEHLLHLGNIIQRYDHMKSGKIAPNPHIMVNIDIYKKMLEPLQAQIDSLNHDSLGTFKDYLKTLMSYTRYVVSEIDVADFDLKETFICARVGALYDADSFDDKALQNFYTCGAGLFTRTPLKSFQAVQDHLVSLGAITPPQWQFCVDNAKLQFSKLKGKSCDDKQKRNSSSRSRSPSP